MKRTRAGITLIEILISILIFGVGVVSIMTLFPLGLMNIRAATRYSRSAYLYHAAGADLGTRNLLVDQSFTNPVTGPWYTLPAFTAWPYDPWLQDTPSYGADPIVGPFGAYRGNGAFNVANASPHNKPAPNGVWTATGLVVAYDPLWRMTTQPPAPVGLNPPVGYFLGAPTEARFASGIGFVRNDPNPGTGTGSSSLPSAHGLQRLTNFPYLNIYPNANATTVPAIFVSPEDVVLQSSADSGSKAGTVSPIVPDMGLGTNSLTGLATPQYDWKYTWMFTGQRTDTEAGDITYVGDVVIFENRPFAVDPIVAPVANTPAVTTIVAGEPVVEAIFGYTNNVTPIGNGVGYGMRAPNVVLLRWAASLPDPEVKVGGWIADVTYERDALVDYKRSHTDAVSGSGTIYPYQRCHWYRLAKRTQPTASTDFPGYREMTVWTETTLVSLTLLNVADGTPYHVNAALVSPYVVNVFPKTVDSR